MVFFLNFLWRLLYDEEVNVKVSDSLLVYPHMPLLLAVDEFSHVNIRVSDESF